MKYISKYDGSCFGYEEERDGYDMAYERLKENRIIEEQEQTAREEYYKELANKSEEATD